MRHVGLAAASVLGALALVLAHPAHADGRDGIRGVAAHGAVVHPGSAVRLAVDLAPSPHFVSEGTVAVLAWRETPGGLAPLGTLARAPFRVGREGKQGFPLEFAVPKTLEAPGRLHVVVTTSPPPRDVVPGGAGALASLGHRLDFDLVPAPNLAAESVEVPASVRVGDRVVATWTVRRTTPGRVGPVSLAATLRRGSLPAGATERDEELEPITLPDDGVLRGESDFGIVREAGTHTVVVRVDYDGDVASDRSDDERRVAFEVAPVGLRPRPVPTAPPPAPPPEAPPTSPPSPPPAANLVTSIPGPLGPPESADRAFAVPYVVENRGAGAAGRFQVTLLLVGAGPERVLDVEDVRDGLASGEVRRGRLRAELPAGTASGALRFRVVADREGRVAQTDRRDDAAEATLVVPTAKPNLSVMKVRSSAEAVIAGEVLALEAIVANDGAGPAAASKVSFALTDPRRGRVTLGESDAPVLPSGTQSTVRWIGRVPSSTPGGAWGVVVTADADREVDEADEADDAIAVVGTITVVTPATSDARPRALALELEGPAELDPGQEVAVRARVANAGGAPAHTFDVVLLLASRERPAPSSRGWSDVVAELDRATEPAGLPAHADSPRRFVGRLPIGIPPGRYFLVAVADPDAGDRDSFASVAVTVRARALLEVVQPGVALDRDEASPGDTVAISATVRNDGNRVAERAAIAVVLVPASTGRRSGLGAVDMPIGSILVDSLRPAEVSHVGGTFTLPAGMLRGRYRVTLRARGPGDTVLDLGGHGLAVRGRGAGPELVAYDGHVVPTVARGGEAVRVVVRVGNLGDAPSPPTRLSVTLADTHPPTPLAWAAVGALAPRQDVELTVRVPLPRDLAPGTRWLRAWIDPERLVPQHDTDDDVTAMAVEVKERLEAAALLAVGVMTLDFPGSAVAGSALDVRARITNSGDVDVAGLEVDGWLMTAGHQPTVDALSIPGIAWRLGRRLVPATIRRGDHLDFAERYALPEGLAPGAYELRIVLDPDRRLPWREGAVSWSDGLRIDVAAPGASSSDLAVGSLDVTTTPGSNGRRLLVTAMLLNRGPAVAPAFDVEAVLTSRADASARRGGWIPLGTRTVPAGVGPGGSSRARFEVDVPAEIPGGAYVVVARVDPRRLVDAARGQDDAATQEIVLADAPPPVAPPPAVPDAPVPPDVAPPAPSNAPGPNPPPPPATPPPAPARDAPDPSLPLALAPLLPADGLARDGSRPVTFLVSHAAERKDGAVLDVLLESNGARRPIGSFDVPPAPAGVVSAVRGRLRAPAEASAGAATLVLVLRASPEPGSPSRAPLEVPVAVR